MSRHVVTCLGTCQAMALNAATRERAGKPSKSHNIKIIEQLHITTGEPLRIYPTGSGENNNTNAKLILTLTLSVTLTITLTTVHLPHTPRQGRRSLPQHLAERHLPLLLRHQARRVRVPVAVLRGPNLRLGLHRALPNAPRDTAGET